jgi:uncharacterized protein YjdB
VAAATESSGKAKLAPENYPPGVIANLEAAIAAADEGLASGVSQAKALELENAIAMWMAQLEHHHPVLSNSAAGGIIGKGVPVALEVKGEYDGVAGVAFNSEQLTITTTSSISAVLSRVGKAIGTLRRGSAVVTLYPAFVDSLPNGTHEIRVSFADAYKSGEGLGRFTVRRPGPAVSSVGVTGDVSTFRYKAGGVGNTRQLEAAVSVTGGASGAVKWSASGPATVSGNGLVTFGGAEGVALITATSAYDASKSKTVGIRVVMNVTAIRTPLKAYYVKKGRSLTLPIALDDATKANPPKPIVSELKFTSSDPKALTVDKKGKVKAKSVKKRTKVRVTVTAADGLRKNITVYVTPKAKKAKKIKLSGYKKKMKVGATSRIKVKVSPGKATGLAVKFKSSKPSGLYVDKAGKVIALKKGKYKVTVRAGGKKARTRTIVVR